MKYMIAQTIYEDEAPFTCKYCGMPSWIDPADQSPPPDYCHEIDHGTSEDRSGVGKEAAGAVGYSVEECRLTQSSAALKHGSLDAAIDAALAAQQKGGA